MDCIYLAQIGTKGVLLTWKLTFSFHGNAVKFLTS
jgi:hypothetical protein